MRRIDSKNDLEQALVALRKADPLLDHMAIIATPITLRRRTGGIEGLLSIVAAQQLSVQSANAIWNRVIIRFSPFNLKDLLEADDTGFKDCGLSAPKIKTIRSIANSITNHQLDLESLDKLSADEAHAQLCSIKGIGPWTADIYLMFCIGHADAFAGGDLALQEALRIDLGQEKRPTAKELLEYAQKWRPWRSVAARLLWSYYATVKKRDGIATSP